MPRLSMQIPHTLGREEATRRIKEKIPKARDMSAISTSNGKTTP